MTAIAPPCTRDQSAPVGTSADLALDVTHLQAFIAVARSGGFGPAADALHLSQPAVSRRVRNLEQRVGAPLLDRLGTGAVLNDAGRALLPHAEAVLLACRDGLAAVTALSRNDAAQLRVAVVSSLAGGWLTERLKRFRFALPDVDLRLRTTSSASVSDAVSRGDAALGLRFGHDQSPRLTSREACSERLIAVCAPEHRFARREEVSPTELARERWLTLGAAPSTYTDSALEELTGAAGDLDSAAVEGLTAQKRMVEADLGLAVVPLCSVAEEIRGGSLAPVRTPPIATRLVVTLVTRRGGDLPPAARAFRSLVLGNESGAGATP